MGFFAIPSLILSQLELSRIELPKLTPSILMETVIISVFLVEQFYFYMHQPIRLDFLKSLSLSWMHHHIVLKSLVAGNMSYEDGGVFSKIYYFNLMICYLYSLNPFIGINETGKYLSPNNE